MSSSKRKRSSSPSIEDRKLSSAKSTPDTLSGYQYEVFLSFCGCDTRRNFTDYLYRSLDKAGVRTFKDNEDHPKGEKIEKILQAIEQSKVSIPIFSQNYASREWCMRELVKMTECREIRNQVILPVFFDVKPFVVREQSDRYEEAFLEHSTKFNDEEIQCWKNALKEVSTLSGWDLQEECNGNQGELVDKIIAKVWKVLQKDKLDLPDHLNVRMDNEEKKIMELMSLDTNDVRIIGIYGKSGAGKTTLAKVIYNRVFEKYDRCCFLPNIREDSQKHGLKSLQKQLITVISEGRGPENIHHVEGGKKLIRERFREKKVLVLLDDVGNKEQLDALAEKPDWFGLGSRIIVTTSKDILDSSDQVFGSVLCEVMDRRNSQSRILLHMIVGSSVDENTKKVLALLEKGALRIGIYGIGGVGKTTLAMQVHDCLKSHNALNGVYWVTISQDCKIYDLQHKIADRVGVDLSKDDDVKTRAGKLFEAFQKKGKVILFCDDIWSCFRLEDIGISDDIKGCSLVLTSRSKKVCLQMGCDNESLIEVGTLSEIETWELFEKECGQAVNSPKINHSARLIAKECAGLPLAIITIAGSLRGVEDEHEWSDTLQTLKQSKEGQEDMDSEVFPSLKLSYDRLKDIVVQQCFLYVATFEEDQDVERDKLINLFVDVGLIDEGSLKADFDKGHTILNKLEYTSLLTGIVKYGKRYVKMHDLLRDMALRITKSKLMVKSGQALRKLAEEKEWGCDLEVVSMRHCDIKKITISPNCPKISTLLLSVNYLEKIPDNFFEYMHELKVLDLSYNGGIKKLPNSVSKLKKLTALIIKYCPRLKSIPSLADLTALRRLELEDTALEEFPSGVENLVNLRVFSLRRHKIKKVPVGIFGKLSSLRYLGIDWPKGDLVKVLKNRESTNLKKLECCYCGFVDWKDYKALLANFFWKAHAYIITVRSPMGPCFNRGGIQKSIMINWSFVPKEEVIVLPKDVEKISLLGGYPRYFEEEEAMSKRIQSSQSFSLTKVLRVSCYSWPGVKLFEASWLSNLQNLEELIVQRCGKAREIITTGGGGESRVYGSSLTLPSLRYLDLDRLPALERIISDEVMLICDSLQEIRIVRCAKLKRIPISLMRNENGCISHPSLLRITLKANSREESEKMWESLEWDDDAPPHAKNALQHLVRY